MAATGSQGPLGPFYLGRGRFICPLRPFFTRTCFCFPAPGFFFFSRWPSGPRMECSTLLATMQTSENTPELSECHSERHALRDPHPSPANFGRIRGKCCAFFFGAVFREIPRFFTVLFLGKKFLGINGIFGECRTIFLGNSKSLLDQCRIFLGICSIFKDLVK